MSSDELVILFGLSYEAIASLLMGVSLIVFSVGITAALILILFALYRRFFKLRRRPQPRNNRAGQGFVLEWLK
ncbi:hypothetical protein ACFV0L_40960 [Streptosporangium canum]|uniref:Oxaloacetate decarboxylase, gamma chain n=1 Tax=Streptosporangium canum TaxID=324952 RepID=A0A1I4EJ06_9ACTN|nr:hypothetical protein [Streptosporangium canum]SFL05249.1 hypothetical protein SAMN05216275_15024 [Streptosporangium canum]